MLEVAAALIPALCQARPEEVLLLGFEDRRGDSMLMLEAMAQACDDAEIVVCDRYVVHAGRWFRPDCHDAQCCPAEGWAVPAPADVPAVAEFVGREISPAPSRAALASRLTPTRPLLTRAVDAMARDWMRRSVEARSRAQGRKAVRAVSLNAWALILTASDDAAPVADLPARELARAIASLVDVHLRDGLIAWLCPGELSLNLVDPSLLDLMVERLPAQTKGTEESDAIVRHRVESRLVDLCACCSLPWAVAPLTVLASYTWWRGDGALTRIALDRALEGDSGYRLALLLERVVDLSIRPRRATA